MVRKRRWYQPIYHHNQWSTRGIPLWSPHTVRSLIARLLGWEIEVLAGAIVGESCLHLSVRGNLAAKAAGKISNFFRVVKHGICSPLSSPNTQNISKQYLRKTEFNMLQHHASHPCSFQIKEMFWVPLIHLSTTNCCLLRVPATSIPLAR